MTEVPTLHVFVRCGELYAPPAEGGPWTVLTLPRQLGREHLADAVAQVRACVRGHRSVRLVVAGPVVLGAALGQGLAHEPTAIEYVQLNQATKEFEVWLSNRLNL